MARILIVEDEEAQRLLYETEISEMGHEVILASDGEMAVEKVRSESPDLLILDLMMPKVHGLDALRKALSLNPNLPVIIHTAYSHFKDNHLSWAAEAYVVKSADLGELRSAIKRTLSGQANAQVR